jgi:hypothetical protein
MGLLQSSRNGTSIDAIAKGNLHTKAACQSESARKFQIISKKVRYISEEHVFKIPLAGSLS